MSDWQCGIGFYTSDGSVFDCTANQGHDGPHRCQSGSTVWWERTSE